MTSSPPGFFVRLMCGIWNTLNFTRRLILNVILVIVVFPKGLVGLFETGWNRIRRRQSTDPEILGGASASDPSLEVDR